MSDVPHHVGKSHQTFPALDTTSRPLSLIPPHQKGLEHPLAKADMASFTTLPPEIRSKIIASIAAPEEIPRAWLTYRLVSKPFQQDVYDAFRTYYLKRVRIKYEIYHLSKFGAMDLDFEFARLSEAGERAVFKRAAVGGGGRHRELISPKEGQNKVVVEGRPNSSEATHEEWCWNQKMLWKRLFRSDRWYLTCLPPHAIVFDSFVMDTDLPGLEIDHEMTEISFLWKPMWNAYLGELEWMQRAEREAAAHEAENRHRGAQERAPPRRVARIWEHRAREKRLSRARKKLMGEELTRVDYNSFGWEDQLKRVEYLESLRASARNMVKFESRSASITEPARSYEYSRAIRT